MRRQTNFGNEYKNLAAGINGVADQLQVHLCLAAAGDAVNQTYLESRMRPDGLQCGCLISIQPRTAFPLPVRAWCRFLVILGGFEFLDQRFIDKIFLQPPPSRHGLIEFVEAERIRLSNQGEQCRLSWCTFPERIQIAG